MIWLQYYTCVIILLIYIVFMMLDTTYITTFYHIPSNYTNSKFNQDFQMLFCLPGWCLCEGDITWNSSEKETTGQNFREPLEQTYCIFTWVSIHTYTHTHTPTYMPAYMTYSIAIEKKMGDYKFLIAVDCYVLYIHQ